MNTRKLLIALCIALTASLSGAVHSSSFLDSAFGQEFLQPPPPMFHRIEHSGISGDHDYLYVLAGGKILVYQLSDMALMKTVDLPDPPSGPSPPRAEAGQCPPSLPPPHGGGPHGLWAGDQFLFVLAGPIIYEYSTPDLTFISSKELPKPEFPKPAN